MHRLPQIPGDPALPHRIRAAGVSLVEVLIAIVVLSVGMLGTLGTMNGSIRLSWSAGARGQAAIALEGIADALRANPAALVALTDAAAASGDVSTTSASGAAGRCFASSGTVCSLADANRTVMTLWRQSLADTLPKGQGTICRDSTPGAHPPTVSGTTIDWQCDNREPFVAKVCWDETRLGGKDDIGSTASKTGFQTVRPAGNTSVLMCTWTPI